MRAGAAVDASFLPADAVIGGATLKPLALEFGGAAAPDVLVVSCQWLGASGWQPLRLQRNALGHWGHAGAGVKDSAELRMDDADLAAALLGGREHAGSGGASRREASAQAPAWPKVVIDGLSPWPLKGRGTIVFDSDYFLRHVDEMAAPGRGPVILLCGAAKLGLPTEQAAELAREALGNSPLGLVALLTRRSSQEECSAMSYGDLLEASAAARTGYVDLSRCRRAVGPRRSVSLADDAGVDLEFVARRWGHGVAIRHIEPPELALSSGCRPGDVVVSANGQHIMDAPLGEVGAALRAASPMRLEVEQPLLEGPFYIREASPSILRELIGPQAEQAAEDLVPLVRQKLTEAASIAGRPAHVLKQDKARVWAGDGGSTSRLHRDNEAAVQFCHVLHGTKIFTVETDSGAAALLSRDAVTGPEVSLPADLPLSGSQATWLASPGVSVAAANPGDIMCFWGGDRHCGTNAMASGPCIALFHG